MMTWLNLLWRRFGTVSAGDRGENLAAEHLVNQAGQRLVARNWRNPRDRRDEIDLITQDGEVLVFVEVKTRTAGAKVPGYYAVNRRKKQVVQRAARAYLAGLSQPPSSVRFDIVEVALPKKGDASQPIVRHFANVPLFPKGFRPDRR